MNRKEFITVSKSTANQFMKDDVPNTAGALTYFAFLSLFPLILLAIILTGIIVKPVDASDFVFNTMAQIAPGSRDFLADVMDQAFSNRNARGLFAVLSVIVLLFSASGAFGALDKAINRAWKSEKVPNLLVSTLINFAMMAGVALLLLGSLIVSLALTGVRSVASKIASETVLDQVFWFAANIGVSLGTVFAAFILVYRYIPRSDVSWRDVYMGAFLAAVAWTIVKELFGLYLGSTFAQYEATYGTLGAAFALSTWIYLSSIIIIAGAYFTAETARVRRLRREIIRQATGERKRSPWLERDA